MKLALVFFFVLTGLSLWFAPQGTPPVVCRGKPLSVTMLEKPGVEMRVPPLPIRFGGTRYGPVWQVPAENPFRLVIKNRDEFNDFWKGLTSPGRWLPPLPEVDFSKEMIVVVGMGLRPSPGFVIMIDGACEVDGQVELFVSKVEDGPCAPVPGVVTAPADVVRIPRSDLPVVFRETQFPCVKWSEHIMRLSRGKNVPSSSIETKRAYLSPEYTSRYAFSDTRPPDNSARHSALAHSWTNAHPTSWRTPASRPFHYVDLCAKPIEKLRLGALDFC